ncbi:MAG: hypothetical protein COV52_07905 [Gammaproteobacteria bacterium CG11_big_fil_rev_8_21_14_0_20_46_22]|nr:MAG: hypothetical protein COW05_03985 [Gammaproteobacteria bacterium CG12_big_fil_rev_8_21_14_0_65_46_12]PIR10680.1 MAG: hypothetical protein COV52_07905 [Gammaproteobacteria bacterium CG11_big_fil_rev_8_21_14_0_20_46_22]
MIHLVPGPVEPTANTLKAYASFLGSPRLQTAFWQDYSALANHLQTICQTTNTMAIMTGEGMLGVRAAMKSAITEGNRVLCVVNGLYGEGMAEIAEGLGAEVTRVTFSDTEFDRGLLMQAIDQAQPDSICCVHCDTPTGLLNPLEQIASLKKQFGVGLLIVDAVSSIGATPVNVDANGVDILIGAGPKALGGNTDVSFVAVSPAAWHNIIRRDYRLGYEALLPFKDVQNAEQLPYLPHWPGIAALRSACEDIINTGLNKTYERHLIARDFVCTELERCGFKLFQPERALRSPSVTAAYLPHGMSWQDFNTALCKKGVQVGRGVGEHANTLFRIGHMGPQTDMKRLKKAMKIIRTCL